MFQAMELVKVLWSPPLIPFIFLRKKDYDRLGLSEIDDEEQDFLDKGVDVRDTSRLGCQVELTKEFEGISILIPEKQVDGLFSHGKKRNNHLDSRKRS